MQIKDVKQYIKLHFKHLKWFYGVDHWKIEMIVLKKSKEETQGETVVNYKYETAIMKIYADNNRDFKDLDLTLRHELCHVVLAPFDEYMEVLKKYVKDKKLFYKFCAILDEQGVLMLERMSRRHRGLK